MDREKTPLAAVVVPAYLLGRLGYGGPLFRQVRLPEEGRVLFEGRYFRLATSDRPPAFYLLARPKGP